jgi:hypothetical protein
MPATQPRLQLKDGLPLTFGIYPGMTGQELPQGNIHRAAVPDDPERTERALALLQPTGRPFRPVPEGQIPAAVEGVLTHFRRVNLLALASVRTCRCVSQKTAGRRGPVGRRIGKPKC